MAAATYCDASGLASGWLADDEKGRLTPLMARICRT